MIRILFLFCILFITNPHQVQAQDVEGVLHSGQRTGQAPFPVDSFEELPNPVATQPEWWRGRKTYHAGWGSTDVRYEKERPASAKSLKKKDRKSTRLNSSHVASSYAVFCLKKKNY